MSTDRAASPTPPPQAVVMQMVMGSWIARLISEVSRLDIPDKLKAKGPQTPAELIAGGEAIAMFGNTPKHGEIPVGLAVVRYHDEDKVAWPHAVWFPEASARNKMEITVAFLVQLKKSAEVLITSEEKNKLYFKHLCKYGVIRRVGKLHEWFGGEGRMLFQSVGT